MNAQDNLQAEFVKMSALLTGFAQSVIAPTIDPIGLPTLFYKTVHEKTGTTCTNLLVRFSQLAVEVGMTDAKLGAIMMGLVNDPLTNRPLPSEQVATVKAIVKLWYLGSWYQPFDISGAPAGTQTVVSDQAYIKGLAWQTMQSHAMGNSTFTFGYWDKPPAASLQDFTGNTDVSEGTPPSTTGWGTSA